MSDVPVLSVHQLKKRIKNIWIVKGISFDVRAGEIFGFLGPNGAGKTTTIRMLVNLIKPTEGSVKVCGYDVNHRPNEALQHVGCIVENPELYPYLTGWENLEHFADMLPGVGEDRIQEVVEIVGMDQRIHDKVKTYSLGMRQRLGIAQALLGRPKLLILDEPTNGLDPQGIKELRVFIRHLASQGLSLLISSHLLSEIQMMCDRVAIIRKGEVIKVDYVDRLLQESSTLVLWKVRPHSDALNLLQRHENIRVLAEEVSVSEGVEEDIGVVTIEMDPEQVPELNRQLLMANIEVFAIEIKQPTLEQFFLKLTEGEKIG